MVHVSHFLGGLLAFFQVVGPSAPGALKDALLRRAFGDLAVQIHWGDAVDEDEDIQWHVDANNSALHMAVAWLNKISTAKKQVFGGKHEDGQ